MEVTYDVIKSALREVLEAEMGVTRLRPMPPKWEGGTLVLKPGDPAHAAKEIPLEAFHKKITAVRERLRVLEQKLNNHKGLSVEEKSDFQALISRAYGSMTTFNVLFQDDEDKFVGMKGE